MVAIILFTNIDIKKRRRVVIIPKNHNCVYSAPNKNIKEEKEPLYFINHQSKRMVYVDRKGQIRHVPYTSFIFPPIDWEETIKDLRDRDELSEINKKEFVKQISKRYESIENELKDLKELILSVINDI